MNRQPISLGKIAMLRRLPGDPLYTELYTNLPTRYAVTPPFSYANTLVELHTYGAARLISAGRSDQCTNLNEGNFWCMNDQQYNAILCLMPYF